MNFHSKHFARIQYVHIVRYVYTRKLIALHISHTTWNRVDWVLFLRNRKVINWLWKRLYNDFCMIFSRQSFNSIKIVHLKYGKFMFDHNAADAFASEVNYKWICDLFYYTGNYFISPSLSIGLRDPFEGAINRSMLLNS